MKDPILLQILQNYLVKIPDKKNQLDRGFTIIELTIVFLIIGILSAIAAPAWDAFVTRQRIRTVNSQVLQALQKAQSQAKSQKEDVLVTFTPTGDPPTVIPEVQIENFPQEELNANGEIKAGMVKLVTSETVSNSITFDYLGSVESTGFTVTISTPEDGLKRCVIVQTILGGMRTAQDTDCP